MASAAAPGRRAAARTTPKGRRRGEQSPRPRRPARRPRGGRRMSQPVSVLLPDLPERLRQLADRLATLGASDVIGTLESMKFDVWTVTVGPVASVPASDARPSLTVAEVTRRIGFSKDVVYDMLRTGELRNVGRGRCKRVAAADVDAWLT